jgi:hypothetical protein
VHVGSLLLPSWGMEWREREDGQRLAAGGWGYSGEISPRSGGSTCSARSSPGAIWILLVHGFAETALAYHEFQRTHTHPFVKQGCSCRGTPAIVQQSLTNLILASLTKFTSREDLNF